MKGIWCKFNHILGTLSGTVLAIVMIIISIDVGARIFFNSPIIGVVDLVTVLIPAVVFLPFADTEIRDHHLRVEVVSLMVSKKWQLVFDFATALLGIIYIGIMVWIFWFFALKAFSAGEYLPGVSHIRTWPSKFAMFMGAGLLLIQFCINIAQTITKFKRGLSD
ncbi:MAG: TRAP transporter small permease [Desulfobacterales bacterium]